MNKRFQRSRLLIGATLLAATLVTGCGDSENLIFTTNTVVPSTVNPVDPINPIQVPAAVNDAFPALGNTTLNQASTGVLTNDTLNGATISSFDTVGSQGGTINLNADGSFFYTPATDFVGVETFGYTLSNEAGDSTAIVTLTSTGFGRFVDNSVADGGTGTQVDPFDTLAEAVAVAQSGDTIYVARGNGTNSGMTGGFDLPEGVNLVGEGTGLILSQTIEPAGTAPIMEGPINCLGDNVIQGVTVDGSAAELLQMSDVGNVRVESCTLANPTDAPHVTATNIAGTFSVTNCTLEQPDDSKEHYVFVDNTDTDVAVAVTDNVFTNASNNTVDHLLEVDRSGSTVLSVDFSRNVANGTQGDQFDQALVIDNGSPAVTLTCQDNLLHNFACYYIEVDDVVGTISGNTITADSPTGEIGINLEGAVGEGTLSVTGNTISNVEYGISLFFASEGPGVAIISNNNIDTLEDSGIRVQLTNDTNAASCAIRNNTITNSGNDNAIEITANSDLDMCVEVVGNTVDDNFIFTDSGGSGGLNVEQLNLMESINTFTAGSSMNSGAQNVAVDTCGIP